MIYVLPYLEGAAIPEEIPNADTLEAMDELDNGEGFHFNGTTEECFKALLEELDA